MPGTFLRIGDYSQIHMIAPSLTNSQVELVQGEAILEVIGLMLTAALIGAVVVAMKEKQDTQ